MITRKEDVNQENLTKEMEQIRGRLKLSSLEDYAIFPQYFQLETSRACNARCEFCAIKQWDKTVAYMPDELFAKVVAEMKQYTQWIKWVCISRAGEPLLDQKLPQRVRMLKEAGIKHVNLTTNVSLLSEAKARALIEAGLNEIMFSIDSLEKDVYEKMRVGLKYEKVVENIITFFKVREEMNADVIVRVRGVSFYDLNQETDRRHLQSWEDFWKRYCRPSDRVYMKRAHNWGNQIGAVSGQDMDIYHPCVLPWSTMHITTMGIIALCPMDYDAKYCLGDLHKNSIAEIWRNDKWKEVRRLHSTGNRNEMSMCKGCRLFDHDFSLEKDQQKQLWES